ncbi:MAG: DUF4405 domain-containing protein [Roseivivax sp.]|nr:DUF4405 domain-containing protein [Roseivivax sp.]
MTLSLRRWATPLTMATFLITGVTGIVLFFHAGGTTARVAHEWIGMAVMVVFLAHLALNWRAFTAYFKRPLAVGIMVTGLVVTLLTSVPVTSSQQGGPNPRQLFGAIQAAPLHTVAELAGQDTDGLVTRMRQAGFASATADSTITELSGGDQAQASVALGLAFTANP